VSPNHPLPAQNPMTDKTANVAEIEQLTQIGVFIPSSVWTLIPRSTRSLIVSLVAIVFALLVFW